MKQKVTFTIQTNLRGWYSTQTALHVNRSFLNHLGLMEDVVNKTEQDRLAGSIGRAIAKQRVRSQMTQEEVAERLGVGNEAVSRIERGRVIPNVMDIMENLTARLQQG